MGLLDTSTASVMALRTGANAHRISADMCISADMSHVDMCHHLNMFKTKHLSSAAIPCN